MEYKLTYNAYRDGLKEGKLLGLKCNQCRTFICPPRKVCPECQSENMDIIELSGKGEILTFTVIHVPPQGFEGPLVVATGKLDEGPWVVGNIEGVDPNSLTMDIIGKRFSIGYKEIPADDISGGERVALTFNLA